MKRSLLRKGLKVNRNRNLKPETGVDAGVRDKVNAGIEDEVDAGVEIDR